MTAIIIPNIFLPSTTISSTAMNANFQAVVDALDESLALDGSEIMTGQLKLANGLVSAPGLTFGSDLNLGLYRKATDELGFATAGTLAMWLDAAGKGWFGFGVDIAGALDVGGAVTVDAGFTMSDVASRTTFAVALAQLGAGFGAITGIAAAATTDLGTITSRHANVTGGGTISSFGSSANASAPLYLVRFAATTTIVHGANLALPYSTSLILGDNDQLLMRYGGSGQWQAVGLWRNTTGLPTVQRFTSGSGTYVPTQGGVRWVKVRMVGGGGGGGARTTNAGAAGGQTSFGGWTANGGAAGTVGASPATAPAGGTGGTNSTGTLVTRVDGQNGGIGMEGPATTSGGPGGNTVFGGGGQGNGNSTGGAGKANTGGGGAGGGGTGAQFPGNGGGGGEYVEFIMTAAQIGAGVSYSVAAAAAGGTAGGNAGGQGAAGQIIVEEYYW